MFLFTYLKKKHIQTEDFAGTWTHLRKYQFIRQDFWGGRWRSGSQRSASLDTHWIASLEDFWQTSTHAVSLNSHTIVRGIIMPFCRKGVPEVKWHTQRHTGSEWKSPSLSDCQVQCLPLNFSYILSVETYFAPKKYKCWAIVYPSIS